MPTIINHHDFFNPNSESSIPPTNHLHHNPPPKPNPRFVSLLLKGIVMVFIISLFFLFLGIAAVALLHFFVAGGAFHRHRLRRRSSSLISSHIPDASSSSSPYSAAELRTHLPELRYVPRFPDYDCAVCLDRFNKGERCRILPACQHMFHSNCVDRWLTKTANCPVCRAKVRLNLGSAGSVDRNSKILWAF